MTPTRKPTNSTRPWGCWGCAVVIGVILAGLALGLTVIPYEMRRAHESATVQAARTIGFALFRYASDHGGNYPPGQTSTEVFQHLIDEHYMKDVSIFCAGMPGKSAGSSDQLKPENVSWDVTAHLDPTSPERVPLVFLTGYKIDYRANAQAVPVVPPAQRTWTQWWNNQGVLAPFMVIYYKDNSVVLLKAGRDGSIPNFIPDHFKSNGKTFRQLMP